MNDAIFTHPEAIVDTERIGRGTRVWAFTHILEGAVLGENCNVCEHCFIENDVKIGNNVTVKSGVYIWDGISVEDDAFLGPNVTFTNDKYPRSKVYEKNIPETLVKKGASIGAGSVIIAGVTIGRHAMVGAGSVVTRDVGDHELVYGNPARRHGHMCVCKEKMDFRAGNSLTCGCGKIYSFKNNIVMEK